MRPSDVPTYVEAGAADVGITGKDVLIEQAEREVSSCSTSASARARWSSAHGRRASPIRRPRRCGAWASCASRRSTRSIAARYFEETGRAGRDRRGQGLGRARAADRPGRGDRRPHRHRHDAARERPGHPRGDRRLDRAPDRQPRRAQAEGGGDRRADALERAACARRAPARVERRRPARGRRRRLRALAPARRRRWPARSSEIVASVRDARRAALRGVRRALRRRRPGPLRVAPTELRRRAGGARPRRARGPGGRDRQRARRRRGRAWPTTRRRAARRARRVTLRELPVRRAAIYVPGGRDAVPVDGRHGRRDRARRRASTRSSSARRARTR